MKILIICIVLFVGYLGLTYKSSFSRSYAPRTENISKVRSVQNALLSYYAYHNGRYPENLQQLVSEGFDKSGSKLDSEYLELINIDLHYIPGLNGKNPEDIILYTTVGEFTKAIVARVDGSAEPIEPEELNRLLIKQGIAPIEIATINP